MKKGMGLFSVIAMAVAVLFFAGCQQNLLNAARNVEVEYGSFTVESSRALDTASIKSAKIVVTSSDMSKPVEKTVSMTNGSATGIKIEKIPVGANRVITVQAYGDDSGITKLDGVTMSLVTDIVPGNNSGRIDWESTKKGSVYAALKNAGVKIAQLTDVEMASIEKAIPDTDAPFIDTASIAKDFKNSALSSNSSSYVLKAGIIKSTSTVVSGYKLQISDPVTVSQALKATNTFDNVAPGKWKIYAISDNGEVAASADLAVVSGEETNVKVDVKGAVSSEGITVYVPKTSGYSFAYAWDSSGNKILGTWPGKQMEDAGEYLVINIPVDSTKIILNNNSGKQTDDLSISSAGGWKFNGSDFESYTPESPDTGNGPLTITVVPPEGYIDVTGSLILHAKYPVAYVWGNGNSSYEKKEIEMKAEENGWYTVTLPLTQTSVIFKKAGSWDGKSPDLIRNEAGEYWYLDGKWYDGSPDDSEVPVLLGFTADKSGSVSGVVTFTIEASDNNGLNKAVITIDDGISNSNVTLSGKTCSKEFEFDTSTIANGNHTFKCEVYDNAQNASGSPISIKLSTTNAPVASITGSGSARFGADVTFSCGSANVTSYEWTVTGATIKSGKSTKQIVVSMPAAGDEVTVSLKVSNAAGSDSASKTVKLSNGATGDFRDESIYFLMTTRFYDGDKSNNEYCWDEGGEYLAFGDGDCAWRGDFKGLAEKLDYIKALGFSAIWITPVVENASGIDYHGYHAYDFSKVDPRYESSGFKYQNLIDACHAKGIKVVQDIVLNHSGNFGERNIFHMFDKETTPYVNKDIPTPAGGKRSPFMKLAPSGNAYNKLMAGLSVAGGSDYDNEKGAIQYGARINAMKEDSIDTDFIYHHAKMIDWNSENCQLGQMAGDCVDLNTENPVVFNYLKDCYVNYINMGVDAFRIDTVKHISRLTFNKEFIPAFMEAGGDSFYIFGETCARYRGRWNEGVPALSPSFYTWKEDKEFAWSQTDHRANSAAATAHFGTYRGDFVHPAWGDGIANHLLKGNNYHKPDYSMRSHLDQIDFPMHWAFSDAGGAFSTAVNTNDPDFNDATWNVVYVDSHDYAPDNAPEGQRYSKVEEWPRNMNLMFSFRGIPCIYYGSEIEFMAGAPIDPANTRTSLDKSGRAYFGDYIEGTVTASDFSEFTATGTVKETLSHPLAQHVTRLNKIRRSIAALRKGQYSTEGCSGSIAFKRRYTDDSVDSFALVAIGGGATFTGIPAGEYIEVITGKTVSSSGSLKSDSIGKDNMRIYVLKTATCEVSGKIGEDGTYLK